MDRRTRRKFESEFRTMLRTRGDNCSLCGAELAHNCRTYGGFARDGLVALTSDCCRSKLSVVLVQGVFTTRHGEAMPSAGPRKKTSNRDVEKAIGGLQSYIGDLDAKADEIARRAGLPPGLNVHVKDSPWKTADADWFKKHADRSHRLRDAFPGELETLPAQTLPPADHQYRMLVRQVEPGKRVRVVFCQNMAVETPDIEPVLHAIFDTLSSQQPGSVVSMQSVMDRAAKYADLKNVRG